MRPARQNRLILRLLAVVVALLAADTVLLSVIVLRSDGGPSADTEPAAAASAPADDAPAAPARIEGGGEGTVPKVAQAPTVMPASLTTGEGLPELGTVTVAQVVEGLTDTLIAASIEQGRDPVALLPGEPALAAAMACSSLSDPAALSVLRDFWKGHQTAELKFPDLGELVRDLAEQDARAPAAP